MHQGNQSDAGQFMLASTILRASLHSDARPRFSRREFWFLAAVIVMLAGGQYFGFESIVSEQIP